MKWTPLPKGFYRKKPCEPHGWYWRGFVNGGVQFGKHKWSKEIVFVERSGYKRPARYMTIERNGFWQDLVKEENVYWHPVQHPKMPHLKAMYEPSKVNLLFINKSDAKAHIKGMRERGESTDHIGKVESIWG